MAVLIAVGAAPRSQRRLASCSIVRYGLYLESADMALYYFDFRDGEGLALDEEGLELGNLEAVQEEAARALADFVYGEKALARLAKPKQMAIEVRDEYGSVMKVNFSFEIARKQ